MPAAQAWNLVADIGGTHARFGLENIANGKLAAVKTYSVSDNAAFVDVLGRFLVDIKTLGQWQPLPTASCLAVACPTDVEQICFTNSPWTFTRNQASSVLNNSPLKLINDFAAASYAITDLNSEDWQQIGGRTPAANNPIIALTWHGFRYRHSGAVRVRLPCY